VRRLIINADDLGANADRDRGIFEAVDAGIVTSASLLANGESFESAAAGVRKRPKLAASTGLHINVSEGRPLRGGLKWLAGEDGAFRGKAETRSLLENPEGPRPLYLEVFHEVTEQWTRVADGTALEPVHFDGHQHIHIFGGVRAVVGQLSEKRWLRVPLDPAIPEVEAQARAAARLVAAMELRSTDHFRGAALVFNPSERGLHDLLRALPEGTTELMVHPGYAAADRSGPFGEFSNEDREIELRALLSPATRQLIESEGIELISFADLLP
jgi:predicted glycoside hydrolase/deacetylase ChbG (UPF0249 family)